MQAPDLAQPWRSDRPWDPAGEPGDLDRGGRRVLWWGVASAAVLLPWNALSAGRPDLLWPGVVAVADVVPAALLLRGAWLRRSWRQIRRRACLLRRSPERRLISRLRPS